MNLRKEDPLLAEFERSLGRILSNWARRFVPPRDGRVQLIAAASQIQQEHASVLKRILEAKPQHGSKSEELAVMFYMPQMSLMGALIHF